MTAFRTVTIPYKQLRGRAEVLASQDDDPFLTCFVPDDVIGLAAGGAVAWHRSESEMPVTVAYGAAHQAAELVCEMNKLAAPGRMLLPEDVYELLPPSQRPSSVNRWRWFYTRSAPLVHSIEQHCCWIAPDEYDEIRAVLEVAFPHASRWPDRHDHQREWFGVRDESQALVACGMLGTTNGSTPSLGSIAVHPAARRQGVAAGMTSWVTRTLLERGHQMISLGSWVGEDSTHNIYRRLGYVDPLVIASGRCD